LSVVETRLHYIAFQPAALNPSPLLFLQRALRIGAGIFQPGFFLWYQFLIFPSKKFQKLSFRALNSTNTTP
jgi:hypothetical protein